MQKLDFDFSVRNKEELANYLTIILCFLETPFFYEASSNLLLRKILRESDRFPFLNQNTDTFEILADNAVYPYVGLSETLRRLIATIIYQREEDLNTISKWPPKEYLLDLNFGLLSKYLLEMPSDIHNSTRLVYNCVESIDPHDARIYLDKRATTSFKSYLLANEEVFISYLQSFIRFKWYGGSRVWEDGKLIVPEPFYEQIFGSSDTLLSLLNNLVHRLPASFKNSSLIIEVRNFLEVYLKNEYVTYDKLGLTVDLHNNLREELKSLLK